MKAICLILSVLLTPEGNVYQEYTEKSFQTMEECRYWKYQSEFLPPIHPVVVQFYTCIPGD